MDIVTQSGCCERFCKCCKRNELIYCAIGVLFGIMVGILPGLA